jgi:hypothetical protein
MRKIFLGIFAVYAASFALVHSPLRAEADGICTAATYPTPVPAGVNGITVPLCSAFGGATSAPAVTPTPFATATGNVLLVQPTNVPTLNVNVVNTPAPGPTDANGIPLVHPTAIGTVQVTGAFPTPIPYATAAGTVLQVQITVAPTPLPAQVNACNVGFTACSNVGTTVADNYSDLLESLFSTGFAYIFNGTSWDRQRDVQGVGPNTSGVGLDAVGGYLQYNTVLPTPSAGMYTAIQGDSNGRMIISPQGLPTPLATQPVSGNISVAVPTATPAATLTQPASSATSVTILAANSATNGWSVCNSSTAILYLAKAASASTTVYSIALPPAGVVPYCFSEIGLQAYRGIITGIWASANGNAIVTQW